MGKFTKKDEVNPKAKSGKVEKLPPQGKGPGKNPLPVKTKGKGPGKKSC